MENKFLNVKPILNSQLKQLYIETYGCQMNVSDSEVVLSILQNEGYSLCSSPEEASLILVNTCSIRDNAEQKVLSRLHYFHSKKRENRELKVGVLGCMAERLQEELLENRAVDLVVGPDSYRELPRLLKGLESGAKQIETILSLEETYADISPVRLDENGVSAFISIMRGCNNFCSYCVVPYVRGRERSRNPLTIVEEAKTLFLNGYREVTLLGQNVNSYHWSGEKQSENEVVTTISFATLLKMVAEVNPKLRVRFSTSHPKDIEQNVVEAMALYPNICKHLHLPVQSGSDQVLKRMNRKYNRSDYLTKIAMVRELIPECSLTTDIIAGFSGESEEEHQATLSILKEVKYDSAFMFHYSERPNTVASKRYPDNVPLEVKKRRLNEIIELQHSISHSLNQEEVGKSFEVLIEGYSKRSDSQLFGRTSQNKVVVFEAPHLKPGQYATVKIDEATSATLIGTLIELEK